MRLVWLTNAVMPEAIAAFGGKFDTSGPWMSSLLEFIRHEASLEIHVISVSSNLPAGIREVNGVVYHLIRVPRVYHSWTMDNSGLEAIRATLTRLKPDVIHLHGTELQYCELLADPEVASITLVSLQGILTAYSARMAGEMSLCEQVRATSLIELVRGRGVMNLRREVNTRARRERRALLNAKFVGGRTEWDHSLFSSLCKPGTRYFTVGEVLRPEFYKTPVPRRASDGFEVIFTNLSGPIKGGEVLIRAVAIANKLGYPIKLTVAGHLGGRGGYAKYIRELLNREGVPVSLLGYLNAGELLDALASAAVFVSASYCDNSPNSIAEAQISGVPVVATAVGGVPSLVSHERTGVLVPPGEPAMICKWMVEFYESPVLRHRLSNEARVVALDRHDPSRVVSQLMNAYAEIVQ